MGGLVQEMRACMEGIVQRICPQVQHSNWCKSDRSYYLDCAVTNDVKHLSNVVIVKTSQVFFA